MKHLNQNTLSASKTSRRELVKSLDYQKKEVKIDFEKIESMRFKEIASLIKSPKSDDTYSNKTALTKLNTIVNPPIKDSRAIINSQNTTQISTNHSALQNPPHF